MKLTQLAMLNVVNSEVCRKNNFCTNHESDNAEVQNQILMNQNYILMLLLKHEEVNITPLEEKIEKLQYDKVYDRWTT